MQYFFHQVKLQDTQKNWANNFSLTMHLKVYALLIDEGDPGCNFVGITSKSAAINVPVIATK